MSAPGDLPPMDPLFEIVLGPELPLPDRLATAYGHLEFPLLEGRPYVISSYVASLDGAITSGIAGRASGWESGAGTAYDHMVMGLLRAAADVVIVGAESLRASPQHLWTPEYIYPALSDGYRQLRTRLGKTAHPVTVIVSSQGSIDLELPVFQSADSPAGILTTEVGMDRFAASPLPGWVKAVAVKPSGYLAADEILSALTRHWPGDRYLIEGGPRLVGEFFNCGCLDELFLTMAPTITGRGDPADTPGQPAVVFAPESPIHGSLYSVKRADSRLFLRYGFSQTEEG